VQQKKRNQQMQKTITFKFSTEDIDSVKEWLLEHTCKNYATDETNLEEYIICQLISNSEYDGVEIYMERL